MGHSYTFEGSIEIAPPLNYAEIIKARKAAMGMIRDGWDKKNAKPDNVFESYMPLKLETVETTEVTDRGPLVVTEAIRLIPSRAQEGSLSYNMDSLVQAIQKAVPGHTWSGEVTALQDDREYAYKLVVDSKGSREVKGSVYVEWGDGSDPSPITDLI